MKQIDFETIEPVDETQIAKLEQRAAFLEQQAAPLRATTEVERRRARQHWAKLARRITRRNAR